VCAAQTKADPPKPYAPSTVKTAVLSLVRAYGRSLSSIPNFNTCPEYQQLRQIVDGRIKELQEEGQHVSRKSEGFSRREIYSIIKSPVCEPTTPTGLLNRVFSFIALYSGMRVSGHYSLMRSDLECQDNGNNRPFYVLKGHLDKGHRGGLKDVNERNWDGRIFANSKSLSYCPVATIDLYLSLCPPPNGKIPNLPFYLAPKTKITQKDKVWYNRCRIGKNHFNVIVGRICESAGLDTSHRYTVHSFRRTVATWLHEDGWDPTAIMAVTRHRSIGGVRAYTENTTKHHESVSESIDIYTPSPPKTKEKKPEEEMEEEKETKENDENKKEKKEEDLKEEKDTKENEENKKENNLSFVFNHCTFSGARFG